MNTVQINAALLEKAQQKTGIHDPEELVLYALQHYFEKKFNQKFDDFFDDSNGGELEMPDIKRQQALRDFF